ncbi:MAG: hypothetical protein RL104_987 [Bacteroidota bacterium]
MLPFDAKASPPCRLFLCLMGWGFGAEAKNQVGLRVASEHEHMAAHGFKSEFGIELQGPFVAFPHAQPKF